MAEYGHDEVPDFGYPSEAEFEIASNFLRKLSDAQGDTSSLPDAERQLVNDIMRRNLAAHEARGRYWRKSTSEIPERMLQPGVPMTIEDIYAMLHVYYWWDDEHCEPEESLKNLLDDLSESRFLEAVSVLHTEFADFCRFRAKKRKPCSQENPTACYTKLKKKKEKYGLGDDDSRSEYLSELLDNFDDEELLGDDPRNGLGERLRLYAVRKLLEAGVDKLEAHDAPNVLEIEGDRRAVTGKGIYTWYHDHLLAGGDLESYLHDVLPRKLLKDGFLASLRWEFEDLPPLEDMKQWDESKQIALARRAIMSLRDYYGLVEVTEDWTQRGVIPPYLYRLRPDGIFPGEI